MTKVVKYPIYPITFAYVNGIFFGLNFKLPSYFVFLLLVVGLFSFCWVHQKQLKNSFNKRLITTNYVAIYLVFSTLGYFSFQQHNQKVELKDLSQTEFTIEVDEVLKSNAYAHRMYARLLSESQKPRVLVTFSKENEMPKNGFVYQMVGTVREVAEPRNLYDFNYKSFLERKKIHYRINSNEKVVKIAEHKNFLVHIDDFRLSLMDQFSKMGYDTKTKGFIEALLFGVQINLDEEVQQQFKDLGILHVLAVSGMHVVVLFATLRFFFRTLMKLPEKATNPLLIVFLIVFTIMAGLSGSVVRAALMCLMAMLGATLGTRQYTVNLMVGSMLLILVVNPNYLFDVGFQLSYLAVFSIVFCYPVLQRFFKVKNPLLNFFSEIVGVSIAAQVGVLPLSIFYFKQVPLLFLFGNIVAIPLTNILLVGWFVQLMFSFVPKIELITPVLTFVAELCFNSVSYISNVFSVKSFELHWTLLQTAFATLFVFVCFWYLRKKTASKIILSLLMLIGFQLTTLYRQVQIKSSSEVVLVSDFNDWILLKRNGKNLEQYIEKDTLKYAAKNYQLAYGNPLLKTNYSNQVFSLSNESWLVIDSTGIYPKKAFDVVVLYDNPDVHLQRLIDEVQPKQLIFHTNNYPATIESWRNYLDQKKVPYYDMRTKGAYVLEL